MHLEPRIVKLLVLFVTSPGALISRCDAIEKIWQNYGGADDGLTQAISFLRKILGDQKKIIIKTIPKKGYILEAMIENIVPQTAVRKGKYLTIILGLAASIVLLLTNMAWFDHQNPEAPSYFSFQNHHRGAEILTPNYHFLRAEEPPANACELNSGAESPDRLK